MKSDRWEPLPEEITPEALMGMHVVLVGNPLDGFVIYGPFKTGADAVDWAGREFEDDDWFAAALLEPMGDMEEADG